MWRRIGRQASKSPMIRLAGGACGTRRSMAGKMPILPGPCALIVWRARIPLRLNPRQRQVMPLIGVLVAVALFAWRRGRHVADVFDFLAPLPGIGPEMINPPAPNPANVISMVAAAMERGQYDQAVYILKHAKASVVQIRLVFDEEVVHLEIKDDGLGFDPEKDTDQSGGMGLQGIQERVQQVGGRLEIESAAAKGTRLSVTIPTRALISKKSTGDAGR